MGQVLGQVMERERLMWGSGPRNAAERRQVRIWEAERALYIQTGLAVVSMGVSCLALYFVYRWIQTMRRVDEETRRMLLGNMMYNVVGDSEQTFLIMVSVYIGYNLLKWLMNASNWRKLLLYLTAEVEAVRREEDA